MTPRLARMQRHVESMKEIQDRINFYKDQINRETLRRQRGLSGAGLKSLAIDKAISHTEKLLDRLSDALKRSEAYHNDGHPEEFENYWKISRWYEATERQLKALQASQRKRVNVYEFSYELLDAIKDRVTIVDMLDQLQIRKKRSGAGRYVIVCPFHDEDTPSCMIYVNDDKYHCFGCQASGDAIDFYQNIKEIEFDEAITLLCEKLEIQIMDADKVEQSDKLIELYKEALEDAEKELKEENLNFAKELQHANNN